MSMVGDQMKCQDKARPWHRSLVALRDSLVWEVDRVITFGWLQRKAKGVATAMV